MLHNQTTEPTVTSNDTLMAGVTQTGSLFIASIRNDYADSPEYRGWQNKMLSLDNSQNILATRYTRLERTSVPFVELNSLKLESKANICKIQLVDWPRADYTVTMNGVDIINDIPILTLNNEMCFDIEHAENTSLDFMIKMTEDSYKKYCEHYPVLQYKPPVKRSLRMSYIDEFKIHPPNTMLDSMPDILYVDLHHDTGRVERVTVYPTRNLLKIAHPTEQLTILVSDLCADSRLVLTVCGEECFNIPCKDKRTVIRFDAQAHDLTQGAEDIDLYKHSAEPAQYNGLGFRQTTVPIYSGIQTVNFSRLESVYVVPIKCKLDKVYQTHYRTYYIPSNGSDDLLPVYDPLK